MKKNVVWSLLLMFSVSFYAPAFAQASVGGSAAGGSLAVAGDGYIVGDKIDETAYKLAPGDIVEANLIVGENDLSLNYNLPIGPDGKIFFPKIGEISLVGKNIPEAKLLVDAQIKQVYKEKYLLSFRLFQPRRIQVYLTGSEDKPLYIGEKKFVSIYGEVSRSGRYEYIPGKKFTDYISYAGGPTPRANLSFASISRQNQKININGSDVIFNGNVAADLDIQPGDVINVPAQFFYFTDFGSFSSMLLTFVALYNTFIKQ
jgi:protein involved in polysaccharide export with SLBB domain